MRQLRQKFVEVPTQVIQRIETTENLEQLENWSMEVLMANSLAELSLTRLAS